MRVHARARVRACACVRVRACVCVRARGVFTDPISCPAWLVPAAPNSKHGHRQRHKQTHKQTHKKTTAQTQRKSSNATDSETEWPMTSNRRPTHVMCSVLRMCLHTAGSIVMMSAPRTSSSCSQAVRPQGGAVTHRCALVCKTSYLQQSNKHAACTIHSMQPLHTQHATCTAAQCQPLHHYNPQTVQHAYIHIHIHIEPVSYHSARTHHRAEKHRVRVLLHHLVAPPWRGHALRNIASTRIWRISELTAAKCTDQRTTCRAAVKPGRIIAGGYV